jgi:hypothetical protein
MIMNNCILTLLRLHITYYNKILGFIAYFGFTRHELNENVIF